MIPQQSLPKNIVWVPRSGFIIIKAKRGVGPKCFERYMIYKHFAFGPGPNGVRTSTRKKRCCMCNSSRIPRVLQVPVASQQVRTGSERGPNVGNLNYTPGTVLLGKVDSQNKCAFRQRAVSDLDFVSSLTTQASESRVHDLARFPNAKASQPSNFTTISVSPPPNFHEPDE